MGGIGGCGSATMGMYCGGGGGGWRPASRHQSSSGWTPNVGELADSRRDARIARLESLFEELVEEIYQSLKD